MRIDQLLGGPTSGSVADGAILCCYRQAPLALEELINGELWTTLGGLYHVTIEKT